jgi:hypothetical protein
MNPFLAKRKELMLGMLVVLLGAAVWHTFFGGEGSPMRLGGPSLPPRASRPDTGALKLFPIDWASLSTPRPSYDPNGRNIFQFGVIPPPPPPVLSKAEQEAIKKAQDAAAAERAKQEELVRQQQAVLAAQQQKAAEQAAQLARNPPPPPPPPKPQPPQIPYKFIGYIGPADNKVAVLHDGTDILMVRRGEELPHGIKVLEIGYESIKFGFTDPQFKDESRTLPMSSSY